MSVTEASSSAGGQVYFEDVAPGLEIPQLVKRCSTRQLVMWAAASGDFYEIHYDLEYSRSSGLSSLVVHGALKNAFLGQLLHGWIAPGGRILRFGCSYRGMDFPDQDIRCRGRVTGASPVDGEHRVELDIWTENPDGETTTEGTAAIALPARKG